MNSWSIKKVKEIKHTYNIIPKRSSKNKCNEISRIQLRRK